MTSCEIAFDNNPEGVYYGGQFISGSVRITTIKDKTIRAIHISIDGHAQVRWTEQKTRRVDGRDESYTETYSAREQYLNARTYCLGHEGADSIELRPGVYDYNFRVALPERLPSSFKANCGQILYEVVVTIDRPWRFDNVFTRPFTIIGSLDLNRDIMYKTPINLNDEKQFYCGCCGVEPLKAFCHVPLSGYAPGQKIPFIITIQNESTIDCTDTKIKLRKNIKFTSHSPHTKNRYDDMTITEKMLGPVLKLTNKEFKDFLQIPAIPPSSLETCSIIHISYSLEFVVYTSGCHRNMHTKIPITIGTVPLIESATNPANVITMQPSAPNNGGDSPPAYVPSMPPSYEDAVKFDDQEFEDDDENSHMKKESFVPKYPVYYNFAAPSAPNFGSNAPPAFDSSYTPAVPSGSPPNPTENNQPAPSSGTTYGWTS